MNEAGTLQETFTRGVGLAGDIGTLVAVTHHTGANAGTHYTHHNHRGDIVRVRSGTTTTATYEYSAFGTLTTQTGTDLSRFKFSSKERESSCGLSYYGHRFYAPQWQRWLCRDPIGERSDFNLYRFAKNDPHAKVDPDGKIVILPWIMKQLGKKAATTESTAGGCIVFGPCRLLSDAPIAGVEPPTRVCVFLCVAPHYSSEHHPNIGLPQTQYEYTEVLGEGPCAPPGPVVVLPPQPPVASPYE